MEKLPALYVNLELNFEERKTVPGKSYSPTIGLIYSMKLWHTSQ